MNDRVKEYIRAWIRKADNDLKNAELSEAKPNAKTLYTGLGLKSGVW